MEKKVAYMGEFVSSGGVRWRVELLTTGDGGQTTEHDDAFTDDDEQELVEVGMLEFDGEEPLLIEWDEESKEVPLCGSTASLTILSPGDRSYVGLYTEDPTGVRMDVYREGALYWSGCLDPEFYEEPYSSVENYAVRLTFSDFGVLNRLSYDLAGMQSLDSLVRHGLARACLNYERIDASMFSSRLPKWDAALSLSDLLVMSENFYDEDGEGMTLWEVLEGILQPLGLRMVQRCGKIWVYDLNALYTDGEVRDVRWMGADQMLGVDRVFNNAEVRWNPYVAKGAQNGTECWVKSTKFNEADARRALTSEEPITLTDGRRLFAYHYSTDMNRWWDQTDLGFVMLTHHEGKGATLYDHLAAFYKIVPREDGTESEGIAIRWHCFYGEKTGSGNSWDAYLKRFPYGQILQFGTDVDVFRPLFTTSVVYLPAVETGKGLRLRLSVNLLMDPRYNPFETAVNLDANFPTKDWMDGWAATGNFVYAPVVVKFRPEGSSTVWVWTNQDVVGRGVSAPVTGVEETYGYWERYDAGRNDQYGYLCWYSESDRSGASGVTGWKKNRPAINPHTQPLTAALAGVESGQLVPFPDMGGKGGELWMEFYLDRWKVRDANHDLFYGSYEREIRVGHTAHWVLMELPEVIVERDVPYDAELDDSDVVYKSVLNASAREDLELETICGTSTDGVLLARGTYYDRWYKPVTALTRGGRTATAEELLIGTLYSQFATRKTRLTGTAEMGGEGVCVYREANLAEGTLLMLTGAVENLAADTMEASFVELRPDEYEKK